MGLEADGAAEGAVGDGFFVAVVTDGGEIRFGAGEDGVEVAFAGDVFDLAAAEIVICGQLERFLFGEFRDDGAPDGGADLGAGLIETDLEKEATVEGRIEVGGKVGGGDEDAAETLQLLQEDVLEAIFHLLVGIPDILKALAQEGVGLVEQEDGRSLVFLVRFPVVAEEPAGVLLGFADPLAEDLGNVCAENFSACSPGELKGRFGLSGAGSTEEEAGEAGAHTLGFHRFKDAVQVAGAQERGKPLNLLLFGFVVEEFLGRVLGAVFEHDALVPLIGGGFFQKVFDDVVADLELALLNQSVDRDLFKDLVPEQVETTVAVLQPEERFIET